MQLDLFDWRPPLPVLMKGVVSFGTSHVDGVAVYWANRSDYLIDGQGLRFGLMEKSGPFQTLKEAEKSYGRETPRKAIKRAIKEAGLAVHC